MTDHNILRVAKDAEHPYSVISNALIQNGNLSWEARGVMCYLLSKPDNWKVRVSDLVSSGKCKLYAIRSILAELEAEGYIVRRRFRSEDGTYHCETEVRETPRQASADSSTVDQSTVDSPAVDLPAMESVQHLTSTDPLMTDSSTNGVPLVDTPPAEATKAKSRPSKRDPRTDTPAITAVRELMDNRNPPKSLYDKIIAALQDDPNRQRLEECRIQWVSHGYNPNSWIWLLDWYVNGIPTTMTRPQNRGPSPPSPPSRPLTGGSWRSPLTGEEHYEGKPKHQDTS